MTRSKLLQGKKKYPITELIFHTSATKGDWWKGKTVNDMRDEIRAWHIQRGWRTTGYHLVIAPDGSVAKGRELTEIGAHVKGHNRGTIGVCLVPVKEVKTIGKFEDYYTEQQRKKAKRIVAELKELTDIGLVTGHNQYANKLCPGFRVRSKYWLRSDTFWDQLIRILTSLFKRRTQHG